MVLYCRIFDGMCCRNHAYMSNVCKRKEKMKKITTKKWLKAFGLLALAIANVCIYGFDYLFIRILFSLEW